MFTATVEGASALEQTWRRVASTVRMGAMRGAGLGAEEGASEARRRHTFRNRTGALERSIRGRSIGWVGDTFKAEILADARSTTKGRARYASFVENGTAAHLIVGNPFLTFMWKGALVHLRYVNHPGTTALPFMHFAFYKAEAVLYREVEVSIADAQRILDR